MCLNLLVVAHFQYGFRGCETEFIQCTTSFSEEGRRPRVFKEKSNPLEELPADEVFWKF